MKCKDCNHFRNTRIGSRGAVYGSCKLKNSVSYTDIRNGKTHSCRHFEARKAECMTREEGTEILQAAFNILDRIVKWYHGIEHDYIIGKNDIKALEVAKIAIKVFQTDLARDINVTTTDAISRQAAIDELVRWGAIPEYNEAEKNILACCIGMLSTLPSIQPQKVIRCNDCKHRDPENNKCDCGMWHMPFTTKDDDFCSYAEAKMEEGE